MTPIWQNTTHYFRHYKLYLASSLPCVPPNCLHCPLRPALHTFLEPSLSTLLFALLLALSSYTSVPQSTTLVFLSFFHSSPRTRSSYLLSLPSMHLCHKHLCRKRHRAHLTPSHTGFHTFILYIKFLFLTLVSIWASLSTCVCVLHSITRRQKGRMHETHARKPKGQLNSKE